MTNLIKILLLTVLIVGCSTDTKQQIDTNSTPINKNSEGVFVAGYGDFGPPQIASKLIGNKWWQWDDPDNHKPVTYNVKVVVFRNIDIERVKKAFPVVPKQKQDYRYVTYIDATKYFSEQLNEFENEIKSLDYPEDIGMMCMFPLSMYKTALAMEKKLRQ